MNPTKAARRWAALAALCAACTAAGAQRLDETVIRVPVASGARVDAIDVTVYRPPGPGPHPLVVLSHGSPRSASDRRRAGRIRFEPQSRAFVAMGYAVAVPTRRGYGDSEGEWAETYGSCAFPDYHHAGLESARDIVATAAAVQRLPGIDGGRIVLAGQSAGGWGSVAASTLPVPGLVGVVNFAGGRGSQGSSDVCREERLVAAAARYGEAARVPQLWIYSPNDQYFGPALARRMHGAFVKAGGRAEFVESPSVGRDGHGYFGYIADWMPRVRAFVAGSLAATPQEAVRRAGNAAPVR
jgi:dienelactone hydrolase